MMWQFEKELSHFVSGAYSMPNLLPPPIIIAIERTYYICKQCRDLRTYGLHTQFSTVRIYGGCSLLLSELRTACAAHSIVMREPQPSQLQSKCVYVSIIRWLLLPCAYYIYIIWLCLSIYRKSSKRTSDDMPYIHEPYTHPVSVCVLYVHKLFMMPSSTSTDIYLTHAAYYFHAGYTQLYGIICMCVWILCWLFSIEFHSEM